MSQLTNRLLFAIALLLGLAVVGLFSRSAASQAPRPASPVGRYQLTVVVEPSYAASAPMDHQYLTDTQTGRVWDRRVSRSRTPGVQVPAGSTVLPNEDIITPDRRVIPGHTTVAWVEEGPTWARSR